MAPIDPIPVTARDVCTAALQEFGGVGAGETPSKEDATFALDKLNRLLDNWNADRGTIYAAAFLTFPLTPNLSPHTIGPSQTSTFDVPMRPVSIEDAGLILTNVQPNVRLGIRLRDAAWWATQTVKSLATTIPTDLYYEPDWPDGSLFFWPVPTVAYSVELQVRTLLANVDFEDSFSLPPGYRDAITLTLAEMLVTPLGKPMPPQLPAQAAAARARIQSNNQTNPRMTALGSGMPRGRGRLDPYYNYLTGNIP